MPIPKGGMIEMEKAEKAEIRQDGPPPSVANIMHPAIHQHSQAIEGQHGSQIQLGLPRCGTSSEFTIISNLPRDIPQAALHEFQRSAFPRWG